MSPEFRLSSPTIVTLTVGPWTLRLTRWDDVLVAQWIVGTWTQRVEVGEA